MSTSSGMGFIMEFAENLILWLMEDPEQRDEAQRAHVYLMKERCERTKAAWALRSAPTACGPLTTSIPSSPGTPRSARLPAAATTTTTS
ncbi:hypothetical protein ZWY2020_013506 [Hordeum vulgare]|nr:hypothetical protein ZWY2020_013506 [Hordeum vulgare]